MARPSSDVAICNMALDLLKEAPISVLSGANVTQVGATCARWYDIVRQSVLSAYNWNFALVSYAAPRGGTPSVSDYTDYYTFPDPPRVCRCHPEGSSFGLIVRLKRRPSLRTA